MDERDAARDRILQAATTLFAREGFDAARVNQIAEEAGVNKALIYYYFKSKEAILDHIIDTLFADLEQFSMEYVQHTIVRLIEEKRLDILTDRFRFVNHESLDEFQKGTRAYYSRIIDFVTIHSAVFRILLLESLKTGKHHGDLFRLFSSIISTEESPLYNTIHAADGDFGFSPAHVVNKFFFNILPIIQFVIYRDDINDRLHLAGNRLHTLFLCELDAIIASSVSGNDIMIDRV